MADLTRGHVLPAIEAVMAYLDAEHPPQRFPKDSDRVEVDRSSRWLRGGTSPSGVAFSEPKEASYFVGAKYLASTFGGPQRIVWVPPEPGRESFVEPDSSGWHPDPTEEEESPAFPREVGHGKTGSRAFRRVRSRVVPCLVDLWCNDYDDLDILINALVGGIHTWNAGAPELHNLDSVGEGGTVTDGMVERGLRYQLTATFVFPMTISYRVQVSPGVPHVKTHVRRQPFDPPPEEG